MHFDENTGIMTEKRMGEKSMKKIYVWGTGCVAGELMESSLDIREIAGFLDSVPGKKTFLGKPVYAPSQLVGAEYDLIVIASRSSREILKTCQELGLDRKKLLFTRNSQTVADLNESREYAAEILGGETVNAMIPEAWLVPGPAADPGLLPKRELENDYVRLKTLELIASELEDVPGCAAEFGVYKGAFARCIQLAMPQRKLYLFDTFEGFDPEELEREWKKTGFAQAHRNTSVEAVLSAMPYPEKVEIRKGLFPDSLNGLEERFAFVSLDVDLEKSTYAGLSYFVPRMARGGCLFLHDYGNPGLSGVRAALERYQRDRGQRLFGIPLCDRSGTLAIRL